MTALFKIIIIIIFITVINFILTTPVFAQAPVPFGTGQASTPAASLPSSTYLVPSSIPPTSPAYTDLFVHNMFHTFSCFSVGTSIIGQPCLTYQVTQNAQGAIQSVPVLSSVNLGGGALGTTASLIGLLYTNPPIRTADYLASLGEGFGIVKEAQAQGVVGSGNAVLSPILTLWQVSRNMAYIIMIVIFVIIGLMVMFRQRINPQTVITAQAALPGLIIGLILITFSYFLAALITDIAFIGTNVVGAYFSAAQGVDGQDLVRDTANQNVLTIMGSLMRGFNKEHFTNAVAAFFNALGDPGDFIELGIPPRINIDDPARLVRIGTGLMAYQVGSSIGSALGAVVAGIGCGIPAALAFASVIASPLAAGGWIACVTAGGVLGGPVIGALAGGLTINDPPAYVGFAVWVIAILVIIYAMLRLLLRLINNFLSIIFLVITAPFHFLAASLPGRQEIATAWVLNMLCNVLAFPAVMGVFYFVNYLMGPITNSPFNVSGAAALDITTNLPVFGGLDTAFIRILLAFGALVTTPAIPDIICRTIGRVGVAGQLLGQEFGGAAAGGRGYLGQAQAGFGAIQQGVSGLTQLGSQRTIQTEIDPATGLPIGPARELSTPGLWRRIRGR